MTGNRVQPGQPTGGQFAANMRAESDVELAMELEATTSPPTLLDVQAAKERMESLGSTVRPMYRGDWERRTGGGRGPTVAESRSETAYRSEANSEIRAARAAYEEVLAAYEASGGSGDTAKNLDTVSCSNCGHRFDPHDGDCPECGRY